MTADQWWALLLFVAAPALACLLTILITPTEHR